MEALIWMRRQSRTLFLGTHYIEPEDRPALVYTHKGKNYRGKWWKEDLADPGSGMSPSSFCPYEADLIEMLKDAGSATFKITPRTSPFSPNRPRASVDNPTPVTGSQQATISPKTPAATSQPSDGQWDCNFISGGRSPMATVCIRGGGAAALPEWAAARESSSDEALIRRIAAGDQSAMRAPSHGIGWRCIGGCCASWTMKLWPKTS